MSDKINAIVADAGQTYAINSSLDWAKQYKGGGTMGEIAQALVLVLQTKTDDTLDAIKKVEKTTEEILSVTKDVNYKLDALKAQSSPILRSKRR